MSSKSISQQAFQSNVHIGSLNFDEGIILPDGEEVFDLEAAAQYLSISESSLREALQEKTLEENQK